jgi:hypothetical protein
MKNLLILLLLLCNGYAYSQTETTGLELGASIGASNKAAIVNMQVGFADYKGWGYGSHIYYNQFVTLTSASGVPDLLGFRYGYRLFFLEPCIGMDYHLLSNIKENDGARGLHMAYGLSFVSEKFAYSAGKSGTFYFITVGLHTIL